jgi:hypothetical protein
MPARKTARKTASARTIQKQVARADARRPKEKLKGAMQAGARRYPEPPFPKQHLPKPGHEAALNPQPCYDAPFYRGSGKLRGQTALITGGDSGIGRAVAVLFAREGADIAIVYLDEHADAKATQGLVEAEGRRCILIPGDVTKRKFCFDAVARTVRKFGRLDVLVNNAAFQLYVSRFEDLTEAHFDKTLKTNLYGYFHMSQAAVARMGNGAAIVNTGSVTGILGNKDILDYSMTKAAFMPSPVRWPPIWCPAVSGSMRWRRGGLDAAQSRRQGSERRIKIRRRHGDEASRPARGDRASLCIPGKCAMLQLHHRRNPAHHWRLYRRLKMAWEDLVVAGPIPKAAIDEPPARPRDPCRGGPRHR